jgi:hypothetical protein
VVVTGLGLGNSKTLRLSHSSTDFYVVLFLAVGSQGRTTSKLLRALAIADSVEAGVV